MMFAHPARSVKRVFLHCSASSNQALRGESLRNEVEAWHRARGFNEVGYHYLIDFDGVIVKGRSLEKTPAAQKGQNTGTIAICCHGLKESDFTEPQLTALVNLCEAINEAYDGKITFHGHKEVAAKQCPVFDYRNVLGLDMMGRMVRE